MAAARALRGGGASQGGSQAAVDAAAAEDVQAAWLAQAVPNFFTEKLLKVVGEAARVVPTGSDRPEHMYPVLPGSHLTPEELGPPALAFVRTVCHLLALDARCCDAVAVLRRQLLRLLHVREFSAEAEFKDACLSLTLPDVICKWVGAGAVGGRGSGGRGKGRGKHGWCVMGCVVVLKALMNASTRRTHQLTSQGASTCASMCAPSPQLLQRLP